MKQRLRPRLLASTRRSSPQLVHQKLIKRLDPNKARGHNMISIRMIKLYGDYIYKPLEMILELV